MILDLNGTLSNLASGQKITLTNQVVKYDFSTKFAMCKIQSDFPVGVYVAQIDLDLTETGGNQVYWFNGNFNQKPLQEGQTVITFNIVDKKNHIFGLATNPTQERHTFFIKSLIITTVQDYSLNKNSYSIMTSPKVPKLKKLPSLPTVEETIATKYSPSDVVDITMSKDQLIQTWCTRNARNMHMYKDLLKLRKTQTIPKIFHFIWLSDNLTPNSYPNYVKGWLDLHPEYIYCFWTDANIPALINQKEYDNASKVAMKADILRYELLYVFGGIYIDCDFWCFKNIEKKILNLKGFSAWESADFIAIGLMGFHSEHKFLEKVITHIPENVIVQSGNTNISAITGPVMFTRLWREYEQSFLDQYPGTQVDIYAFSPEFCYGFTYQDHYFKRGYTIKEENYAFHMWGNSWGNDGVVAEIKQGYANLAPKLVLNATLRWPSLNYGTFDEFCHKSHSTLVYALNVKRKFKLVHLVGQFFTGGIERLIYYFDLYGNFDNIDHYLLYMPYLNTEMPYPITRMKLCKYNTMDEGNKWLRYIDPDAVLDHVGIYFTDSKPFYKQIQTKVVNVIHGAIKYNSDLSIHQMKHCIHLYDEKNKHPSWLQIPNNDICTLGTELQPFNPIRTQNEIIVFMMGRVSEEKIPLPFLEKLCAFSRNSKNIKFNIYGAKNNYNSDYTKKFNELIGNSSVVWHGHIDDESKTTVYKNSHILLIPSEYETGSFACLEGLSYGCVIIGRNSFGMKDLVDDNCGYLCDSDDEIITVLQNLNHDILQSKSNHAYTKSANFDIKIKVKSMETVVLS
jgi:mannosyltransferase OCH1-like enzyme